MTYKFLADLEDRTDHTGTVFPTKKAMCEFWNVKVATYDQRIKKGISKEEALTTKRLNQNTDESERTDHTGRVFETRKDMFKYWGIPCDTGSDRLKRGWSIEQALTTKVDDNHNTISSNHAIESRTDHTGRVFDSVADMCEFWGIKKSTYKTRMMNGSSKEEALTFGSYNTDIDDRTDHTGRVFDTKKAMCEFWGVTFSLYYNRIKSGATKEQALTGNKPRLNSFIPESERTDHTGRIFGTKKEMCDFWGVTCNAFNSRIKNGWSLEDALTGKNDGIKSRTDHTGRVFETKKDMCKFWNINYNVYIDRINAGWTIEDALTTPSRNSSEFRTDHTGRVFDSVADMCEFWGVSNATYNDRVRKGHSKEKALTGEDIIYGFVSSVSEDLRTDHLGNVFESQSDMCKYWDITSALFYNRMRSNHTIIESLGIIPTLSNRTVDKRVFDIHIINKAYIVEDDIYYMIKDTSGNPDIWSAKDIIEYATKYCSKQYANGNKVKMNGDNIVYV